MKKPGVFLQDDLQNVDENGILKFEMKIDGPRSKLLYSPDLSSDHLAPENNMNFSIPKPPTEKKTK